jgi:HAD superfamily hydrolase (TIGR01509 family)
MSKKLFIFDLDGVLVEACDWHRDALNLALLEVCNYSITQEDHENIFNGIPTSKKLIILSEMGIVPANKHKLIHDLKQHNTISLIEKNAYVRVEKIEMLKQIKDKGHLVCCYTNSIKKTALLMLEKTGIVDLFDLIITNQDVSSPKPNPEGYNTIIDGFKIKRKQTYIIEDSEKGLAAAHASGANVIEVKNAASVDIQILKEII